MEVLYLDTNIYLDYLLDRVGKTGKRLGVCAAPIFWKAAKSEIVIAVSDWNMKELDRQIDITQTGALFSLIGKSVRKVFTTENDKGEARKLSETNFDDALHVVLAKKAGARFLITRNVEHFAPFSHIIEPRLPEEFR